MCVSLPGGTIRFVLASTTIIAEFSCDQSLRCHPGRAPQAREPGSKNPCSHGDTRSDVRITGIHGSRIGLLGASRRSPSGMTAEVTGASQLDRKDRLDLDRDLAGQRAHADGGAGMAPGIAEHFDEQVGAAVDHLGLVGELGHGVDHAEQLDHVVDAVERAERLARRRQQAETDQPRAPIALLHADVLADLAGEHGALLVARALAGQEQEIAGKPERHVVGDRRRHRWKDDAEFLQARFRTHRRLPKCRAIGLLPAQGTARGATATSRALRVRRHIEEEIFCPNNPEVCSRNHFRESIRLTKFLQPGGLEAKHAGRIAMRAPDDNAAYTLERLTERAARLIPVLRERAVETSKQRQLPDKTVADLWDADLFHLLKPKKFGGPAVRPDIAFQVADQLGRGDGSAAWIWSVMTIHDLSRPLYPEKFQQEYWGTPHTLSASSFSPGGAATPDKDGFRLSGKWSFCSGIDNAQWMFLGAIFGPPSGSPMPDIRYVMVPQREG